MLGKEVKVKGGRERKFSKLREKINIFVWIQKLKKCLYLAKNL